MTRKRWLAANTFVYISVTVLSLYAQRWLRLDLTSNDLLLLGLAPYFAAGLAGVGLAAGVSGEGEEEVSPRAAIGFALGLTAVNLLAYRGCMIGLAQFAPFLLVAVLVGAGAGALGWTTAGGRRLWRRWAVVLALLLGIVLAGLVFWELPAAFRYTGPGGQSALGVERWTLPHAAEYQVVAENTAFLLSPAGELTAMDLATGQALWQYEPGGAMGQHTALTVAAGRLWFLRDWNTVVALSQSTGEKLWEHSLGEGSWYRLITDGEQVYPYADYMPKVIALSAASGTRLWEYQPEGRNWSAPELGPEAVYFSAEGKMVALARDDGRVLWQGTDLGLSRPGRVLFRTNRTIDKGYLTVFDLDTRSLSWEWVQENTSFRVLDSDPDTLYLATYQTTKAADRFVHAIDLVAADRITGAERWRLPLPVDTQDQVSVRPVPGAPDRILVTTEAFDYPMRWRGDLFAVDRRTGATLWAWGEADLHSLHLMGATRDHLVFQASSVRQGDPLGARVILAFDAVSGQELWRIRDPRGGEHRYFWQHGRVVVGGDRGELLVLAPPGRGE